jgi:hypothetical protein
LRNSSSSPSIGRLRPNTEDHADLLSIDLDPLDEGADDRALRLPPNVIQVVSDGCSKVFQPTDHQPEVLLLRCHRLCCCQIALDGRYPLLESFDARGKVLLLDDPIRIAVDQSSHASMQLAQLALVLWHVIPTLSLRSVS